MGATESRSMLLDYASNDTNTKPKNADYYNGKRFFKTSRAMYPQYTHGWLFGYYVDDSYFQRILYETDQHGTDI